MYWWTVFRCCVTVFVKDWLWRSHLDIGFANWLIYPLAAKYPCAVFLRKRDRFSELDKFKCLKVGGWLLILPLCEIKSCGVYIAWKVSKYGVTSGPYFPVFSPNTGKYGPEITPYLDTFHAVVLFLYIKTMRRRTIQTCSIKLTIKKGTCFLFWTNKTI